MKLSDALGCVGGTAFLLLASIWVPFVGPLISLLTPLIFLYYTTKLGLSDGLKLAAVTLLAMGALASLAGQPQIIVFCLEYVFMGILLAALFKRNLSLGNTVLAAVSMIFLAGVMFLFILGQQRGLGPFEMILLYLEAHLNATIDTYREMGLTPENAAALESYGRVFMDTISRIFISLMIIGTGLAVWLNIMIAKPVFRLGRLAYPDFGPLDQWKAPEGLVWGAILSGFALVLSSGDIQFLAINVFIVIMAIYFFNGLAIGIFFLNKFKVPTLLRVVVYIIVLVQQVFVILLAGVGLFDQWIDFRKTRRRKSE